jgi:hypothetical protein
MNKSGPKTLPMTCLTKTSLTNVGVFIYLKNMLTSVNTGLVSSLILLTIISINNFPFKSYKITLNNLQQNRKLARNTTEIATKSP